MQRFSWFEFIVSALYLTTAAVVMCTFALAVSIRLAVPQFFNIAEHENFSRGPFRLLDGVSVEADQEALRPVAVMVENHFEAQPIAGLEDARIVYEAVVEGDITRFLVIFDPSFTAKQIGPVRSARPYFVTLAEEWDPIYFHAGGSPDALTQIRTSLMYNINEISADGIYFWRDPSRPPPHNLFTSADQIKRALTLKDLPPSANFEPWKFYQPGEFDRPSSTQAVVDPSIFINSADYRVDYVYHPSTNSYTRMLAGEIQKSASGIILRADNVVIQHVEAKIVDELGRHELTLDGRGLAEIYRNGQEILGSWRVTNGRTRFYDERGEEVVFVPGTVWISLSFE